MDILNYNYSVCSNLNIMIHILLFMGEKKTEISGNSMEE